MSDSRPPSTALQGIAGSPGVAIGRVVLLESDGGGVPHRHVAPGLVEQEVARFHEAVARAVEDLSRVAKSVSQPRLMHEVSVLEAYGLMLADPALKQDVERRIRTDHQGVEWAVDCSVREMAQQISGAGDPYLAERSHDFLYIGDLVQRALHHKSATAPEISEPAILVAHDLSPAETAGLDKDRVLGIATEVGTRTSHTAILARALEIPAVVGVEGLLDRVGSGDTLVVDGLAGEVVVSPSDAAVAQATRKAEGYLAHTRELHAASQLPAQTKCGTTLTLRANVELPAEVSIAIYEGAQGIGLYRTEFLYVSRNDLPLEEEQFEAYREVLSTAAGEQVTLRTFDIGADKAVDILRTRHEHNPALGQRAVRLGLSQPELFLVQLRAMVRASAFGNLRIMIPMVSTVTEMQQVRQLFNEALAEIDERKAPRAEHIPLGAMVEVPAAAVMASALARHAEFMSIGTNDLVQYTLAVDRSSRRLAHLASHFDPAVLRLISMVVRAGVSNSIPVGVCGAMASDPLAAVLLIGLGIRELSMEAAAISQIKESLGRVELKKARNLAQRCLKFDSASDVVCAAEDDFSHILSTLR